MRDLTFLILPLFFILDVILAEDDGGLPSVELRGQSPLEVNKRSYLFCEIINSVADTDYNMRWKDPNENTILFQGEDGIQNMFVSRDSSTKTTLNFKPLREDDAGIYTCLADINGQTVSKQFKVITFSGIVFEDCASRQAITSGEAQALIRCRASAGGTDLTTYWLKFGESNILKSGEDNKYANTAEGLIIFNISKTDELLYEFNAKSDKTFQWKSRNISVQVQIKPKMVSPPTFTTAKVDGNFSMLCRASGDPKPTYTWQKQVAGNNMWINLINTDRIVIDEVHGELKIKPLRKEDEGAYKCNASNGAGSAAAEARLEVLVPPKIEEVKDSAGKEGTSAFLMCKVSGDPAPEMMWTSVDTDTSYTEGAIGDVTVSVQKDEINHVTVSQLKFENLEPSHMGDYTCSAKNSAGEQMGTAHLEVQFRPNFNNQPSGPFYNWHENTKGNVTCVINGNPMPVVQWFKGGVEIKGQSFYTLQTVENKEKFQKTSYLIARLDYSNEDQILGDYLCKGLNSVGTSDITIKMERAEKPPAPGNGQVSVKFFTARAIQLVMDTPVVLGPPVKKFRVTYSIQGDSESVKNKEAEVEWRDYIDDEALPKTYITLENLKAKTEYSISVRAVNDVDESDPYVFIQSTKPYSAPQAVVIDSLSDSLSSTTMLLKWEKPDDGGSLIQKYTLRYREVEIYPNRTFYEVKLPKGGFITKEMPPATLRYTLTQLIPGTYYQVELQALNSQGLSPIKSFIFKTKDDPNYVRAVSGSPLLFTAATVVTVTMATLFACLQVFI